MSRQNETHGLIGLTIISLLLIIMSLIFPGTSNAAGWGPYQMNNNSDKLPTWDTQIRSDLTSTRVPGISTWEQSWSNGHMYWVTQMSNMPRATDCRQFFTVQEDNAGSSERFFNIYWGGNRPYQQGVVKWGTNEAIVTANASGVVNFTWPVSGEGSNSISWRMKRDSPAGTSGCPTSAPTITFYHRCWQITGVPPLLGRIEDVCYP